MASYDIKAVMLHNRVEGWLPVFGKGEMGLALFLICEPAWRLVIFFVFLKKYYSHLDLARHQN